MPDEFGFMLNYPFEYRTSAGGTAYQKMWCVELPGQHDGFLIAESEDPRVVAAALGMFIAEAQTALYLLADKAGLE